MGKKSQPEGKKYSYMDTYGDLVTLLLCFFVLLFAMSTVEEAKYNAFVEALNEVFGHQPLNRSSVVSTEESEGEDFGEDPPTGQTVADESLPAEFVDMFESIQEYIQENGMEGQVSAEQSDSGVTFIRLSNNLLFDGDSSTLRSEVFPFLDFLGECFGELESEIFRINMMGHTAAIAGSGVDDWILSSERAGEVASYFEKIGGFPGYKLETTGYGRQFPIGDNQTDEGRAANRRVDIVVIGQNDDPQAMAQAMMEAYQGYFPSDDTQFFEGDKEYLPGGELSNVDPAGGGEAASAGFTDMTADEIAQQMAAMAGTED